MSQKVPDESEILQAAKEARSVFARLDALLRRKEEAMGLSPVLLLRGERNERELASIFDGESRDSFEASSSVSERQDSTMVSVGEENTLSQHPLSCFDGEGGADERDLAEVLQEARAQSRPTIHPAFPNTFKVRHAQGARELASAEKAIAAAAAGTVRPVRPKTPLNPALMVVQRPKAEKKMGWQKRGRGGGGGGGYAKRPYDAEHAERMRRRAVSGAPKKRKVYSRGSGGYGGGGMGMMDPEERYAEQRDDARSNRDGTGTSDRGGGGATGNTRGWKGL